MNHSANHLTMSTSELRRLRQMYADAVRQLEEGHQASAAQAGDISQAYGGYEECVWAADQVAGLRDDFNGLIKNVLLEDLRLIAERAGVSAGIYGAAEEAGAEVAGGRLPSGIAEV